MPLDNFLIWQFPYGQNIEQIESMPVMMDTRHEEDQLGAENCIFKAHLPAWIKLTEGQRKASQQIGSVASPRAFDTKARIDRTTGRPEISVTIRSTRGEHPPAVWDCNSEKRGHNITWSDFIRTHMAVLPESTSSVWRH